MNPKQLDFYAGLIYEKIFRATWKYASPNERNACLQAADVVIVAYEMDRRQLEKEKAHEASPS